MKRMTNNEYSKLNKAFRKACELANVKPTLRQASKFRRKKGLAAKFRVNNLVTVNEALKGDTNET